MVLSIGAPCSVHPTADPLDDVRWADAQPGIAAVWFIDHLQGWLPRGVDSGRLGDPHALLDPFTTMAAAAAQSKRVTLALGVTDPLRRAPAVLLQTALTIAWLGRRPVLVGLGAGAPENLRPYGLEREGRVTYVRDAAETITALRSSPGMHDGGGPTWPRQRATVGLTAHATVQLWIGAHGPRMLDVTAAHGDGWLPGKLSPRNFAALLQQLRDRMERQGRDPASLRTGMFAWAALAPTRAESEALLLAPVVRATALYRAPAAFTRHGVAHPLGDAVTPDYLPGTLEPEAARRIVESIPQAVVRDAVICGSLDDVRQQLGAYEEAGCEHIALYDAGRYVDAEGLQRSRSCLAALAADRVAQPLLPAAAPAVVGAP